MVSAMVSATASATHEARLAHARAIAASVPDPEIPVLTLDDLGILRAVDEIDGRIVVTLTPTYTACPATQVIAQSVSEALADAGFVHAQVRLTLSPPWTTDWISEAGRRKLRAYGIAPPGCAAGAAPTSIVRIVRPSATQVRDVPPAQGAATSGDVPSAHGAATSGDAPPAQGLATSGDAHASAETIACPLCDSGDVEPISAYGSTPCKALYRCLACREPFDYFKPY